MLLLHEGRSNAKNALRRRRCRSFACRSLRPVDPDVNADLIGQSIQRKLSIMSQPLISCAPDVMGGTPVFAGTRVPVQTLLDYLEAGESIDEFLEGFPTVKREQVIAFLEEAKARMVADAA